RPRSTAQETSGTLSYHAIRSLQDMQADGGETIERRSGTRAATTFRKLPTARAGANSRPARAKSMSRLSASGVPELRDEPRAAEADASAARVGDAVDGRVAVRVARRADREIGDVRDRAQPDRVPDRQRVHDHRPVNLDRVRRADVAE